jgi:prolyl-tRNA synthetase
MTHGDDDGLRVPPRIAPHQIIIVPMLRDNDEDEGIITYCRELLPSLNSQTALGEPLRAHLDLRALKATNKRWGWVKKGAPVIVEIGGRDVAGGNVCWLRRDALYSDAGKVASTIETRDSFVAKAANLLADIQASLHAEATTRRDAQIHRGVDSLDALAAFFSADKRYPGWVELGWSRPTGAELDAVVATLKAHKLTIRNTPMQAAKPTGTCIFTGEPAIETIYVARAY